MTARNEFDIITAIAKSTGEATLVVKVEGNPVPCRIPVKMVNVNVETDTDGTTVSIPCEAILPTIPDIASLYPQTATSAKISQAAREYLKHDLAITKQLDKMLKEIPPLVRLPEIKDVIHNSAPKNGSVPATIVFWTDGTKTVVKAINEEYDPEKGIAMAFVKKMFGNKGNYFNQIKKWLPKVEQTEVKAEEDFICPICQGKGLTLEDYNRIAGPLGPEHFEKTEAKAEQASEKTEEEAEQASEETETEEKITCPIARCHLCTAPHEHCPFDRNPDRLIPKSKYVEWVTAVTGVEPKEEK